MKWKDVGTQMNPMAGVAIQRIVVTQRVWWFKLTVIVVAVVAVTPSGPVAFWAEGEQPIVVQEGEYRYCNWSTPEADLRRAATKAVAAVVG